MWKIFQTKLNKIPNLWMIVILILSVGGLLISIYLTKQHYNTVNPIFCPLTGSGCEVVMVSKYSEIFGIPLSVFGIIYYTLVIILSSAFRFRQKDILFVILAGWTTFGLLFSLCLEFIQIFLIQAICFYCSLSAIICLLLFVVESLMKKYKT